MYWVHFIHVIHDVIQVDTRKKHVVLGASGVGLMIFESGMHFDFEKAQAVGTVEQESNSFVL